MPALPGLGPRAMTQIVVVVWDQALRSVPRTICKQTEIAFICNQQAKGLLMRPNSPRVGGGGGTTFKQLRTIKIVWETLRLCYYMLSV